MSSYPLEAQNESRCQTDANNTATEMEGKCDMQSPRLRTPYLEEGRERIMTCEATDEDAQLLVVEQRCPCPDQSRQEEDSAGP